MTRGGTLASADMAKLPLLGASFTSCLAKTTSALRPMTGTNSRRCHRRRGTSSSTFAITPLSASLQTGVLSAASLSNKPPPLWVHDLASLPPGARSNDVSPKTTSEHRSLDVATFRPSQLCSTRMDLVEGNNWLSKRTPEGVGHLNNVGKLVCRRRVSAAISEKG